MNEKAAGTRPDKKCSGYGSITSFKDLTYKVIYIFGVFVYIMFFKNHSIFFVCFSYLIHVYKKNFSRVYIHKIIVFPEKDWAFIYMNIDSKSINGEPMHAVYRMGIPSVSRFEAEVRAAEMAINLPPERWTQIEYRRMEGV
uniref:DUF1330 domain-containing protein n=1 Tax=Heterorhabditis bacteriophora TaxID=37862 RepID=A0A1I7WZ45_HETBA